MIYDFMLDNEGYVYFIAIFFLLISLGFYKMIENFNSKILGVMSYILFLISYIALFNNLLINAVVKGF